MQSCYLPYVWCLASFRWCYKVSHYCWWFCSTWLSHGRPSLMRSTMCANIFMLLGLHAGQLWSVYRVTSLIMSPIFCIFGLPLRVLPWRSLMQIGLGAWMTDDQRGAMLSSLVATWLPGVRASKPQYLGVALQQSTRWLPMPQLSLFGYSLCWESWESLKSSHRFFGVIILVRRIIHLIQFFMLVPSTSRLTIIL